MKRNKGLITLQIILIGVACVMIAVGALRGEAETVLNKAINICLECIGIG